jgi:hypothetical protein
MMKAILALAVSSTVGREISATQLERNSRPWWNRPFLYILSAPDTGKPDE